MFEALVSGLVAGWGVAVPLGAIGVMLVDLGMRAGFRSAAPAAAAVATADLLYAAAAAAAGRAAARPPPRAGGGPGLAGPPDPALKLPPAGVLAGVARLGLGAARARRGEPPAI